MLDTKFIRENVDLVKQTVKNKRANVDVDKVLELDRQHLERLQKVEDLRRQRNEAAAARDIEKGKAVKEELDQLEKDLVSLHNELVAEVLKIPNLSSSDTPVGADESANQVLRKWGEPKKYDFEVKDHLELGELLDVIDMETAGKVTGSRFYYLKNELVLLELAIVNYVFKVLGNESLLKEIAEKAGLDINPKPFVPVFPPIMIKPETYIRMARLDDSNKDERYHLEQDDLYLIGSAEHTLGPIYIDQTLDENKLPLRYVGYTPSFRREAGSYGKDVRGILRVHQFDKIEMETFTLPEDGQKEQDFIVAIQEHLMQSLELPYQVVLISTGDTGAPDFRQIDIETWMPAQNLYRETHSSDYNTDYQSRRLNTKVKRKDGQTQLVHMNDATAFAIGRILIAIMENNQQEDGSVRIPEVLVPYTGFSEIRPK
jgi:seryl-tRNA synthetase